MAREYCPRERGQFDSRLVHGMALAKNLPHPPRILLDYRHGQATGLLRNVTAWGYLKTTLMVFRRA